MTENKRKWVGLHEELDTQLLREKLANSGLENCSQWGQELSSDEASAFVAAHFAKTLSDLLLNLRGKERAAWNRALQQLADALSESGEPLSRLSETIPTLPLRQLLAILPEASQLVGAKQPARPDIPLSLSALLTGSERSPSLVSQIEKELASADRVDWLVSFVKWSGVRPLRDILRQFTDQPAESDQPKLRLATTSYLGATDAKAIEFFLGLPNTEVRVSYDTHRTRLHAKAYLFHRNTGYGNAYVGSANLSRVALDEGLEWTAKISQHELPYLWRQVVAAFETHWEDPSEFEPLDEDGFGRFEEALRAERTPDNSGARGARPPLIPYFELRPFGYQQEILESIEAERRNGHNRHLLIAATGTGKTMIGAFDYKRYATSTGGRPSLLFVAHREEILTQSLASFRQVLRDNSFGDLLVGGATPSQTRHLFCSVQSWNSRNLDQLEAEHFDYVVLDEAHHASADSYQRLLQHLQPKVLLGLTATPERADGRDIRADFGGRYTHEIRLADAIERRLLSPFHYFGIGDHPDVDFSTLRWQRGGYALADLNRLVGANEVRARWTLQHLNEYVAEPSRARGLGFCVSQQHAQFMAQQFTAAGLPSIALTAESPGPERERAQRDLVQGRIQFIFTVDLYNEGIDIPEVDTVLLLRPTESLTVYLQQLGRGLRLHPEKAQLTVLDFIAPQHRRFRFAERFRALSAKPEKRIDQQIEAGFPWLPSGCLVHLDRIAGERVLGNIRETLSMRRPAAIGQMMAGQNHHGRRPSLQELLDWMHLDDPGELLRWGLPSLLLAPDGSAEKVKLAPFEDSLARGVRQLAQSDDVAQLEFLLEHWRSPQPPGIDSLTSENRLSLALAHSLLWGSRRHERRTLADVDASIFSVPELKRDLCELLELRIAAATPASGIRFQALTGPLELHASYSRDQILLGLGKGSFEKPHQLREGVIHIPERRVDAFFVTIQKSESDFSPSTMYEDYAVTERLFHWQSQSTTSADSATGQRYIRHRESGYTPLLFLRHSKKQDDKLTAPYVFCGPLTFVRAEGDRPMSVIWRLEHPMPAKILRFSRQAIA